MNIPIETVVDLLMQNASQEQRRPWRWFVGTTDPTVFVYAEDGDELRSKVREYLLTLVPKPVMLSECEEGTEFLIAYPVKRIHPMAFCAKTGVNLGLASGFQVIQPVEVQ